MFLSGVSLSLCVCVCVGGSFSPCFGCYCKDWTPKGAAAKDGDSGTSGRSLGLREGHVDDVLRDMRGLVTGVQALLEAPIMRGRHLFTSGGQRYAKEISIQILTLRTTIDTHLDRLST